MRLRYALIAFVCLLPAGRASADVPTPKVTKVPSEKPGTPGRNYAFFSTDIDQKLEDR